MYIIKYTASIIIYICIYSGIYMYSMHIYIYTCIHKWTIMKKCIPWEAGESDPQ